MEAKSGFLENLYLYRSNGHGNKNTRIREERAERTKRILDAYHELTRNLSPAELEREARLPEWLWRGMRNIGLFGLNIPEDYGGKGLTLREYLHIIEVMARTDLALAIIPLAHLSIGIKGILLFGNEDQRNRYLPKAASGEMIFAYALTEPEVGSDARHIQTLAEQSEDGTGFILNGTKTYITNGGYAGGLTVFARMKNEGEGVLGAFIVETDTPGITVGRDMPKMGLRVSSTTTISFTDVRVPAENLLGKSGDGFRIAMTILNYGRLGLGAASSGVMKQSIVDMVTRASSRRQFGVPIASFPLIQEKIAQAEVNAAVTAAMTERTAELLENDPEAPVAVESSHTKLFGTTRAWATLYDALQVAGGAGYLTTQPYEKRLRDFRVTTLFEGTTEIHSIYPALYLLRTMQKEMGRSTNGIFRLFSLLGKLFAGHFPNQMFAPTGALERKAIRFLKKASSTVRHLLVFGIFRYGRNIVNRQFLLRRITYASLYAYGVISLLNQMARERESGRNALASQRVLMAFLEQGRSELKRSARISDTAGEQKLSAIYRDLERVTPVESSGTPEPVSSSDVSGH